MDKSGRPAPIAGIGLLPINGSEFRTGVVWTSLGRAATPQGSYEPILHDAACCTNVGSDERQLDHIRRT